MTDPPTDLLSLLLARAGARPDRVVYRYLGDTAGPVTLTGAGLEQAARSIAARLRDGRPRGERALLVYPPGLEFIEGFFGCLGAGAIAVPAPPLNPLKPRLSLQRIAAIVESARPSCALTLSSTLATVAPVVAEIPAFAGVRWIATDAVDRAAATTAALSPARPEEVALIQYTSGSTSTPKGAALTHASVMHNVAWFDDGWEHTPDAVGVNWLPAFHDLGLVYGILAPLWGGFLGIQMSPIDVIQRPALWLKALSEWRATHSCGPNFIYDLCARKVRDEDCAGLDLGAWRVALTAAEPVRAETLERFARRFAPYGFNARAFCPGYGLSEGTCKVVAVAARVEPTVLRLRPDALERHAVELARADAAGRPVVGCGRPGGDVCVAIVEPETRVKLAGDRVGEVWVSGPDVAQSYWNDPAETESKLRARLADEPDATWLRTGDLGFLRDGELFITGRIKDVIIVRGANHYPQDIEHTAQDAHPAVRAGCCAAFSYDEDGEERLAVVAEIDRPREDTRDVIEAITRAIAEVHGLRAHRVALLRAGTVPKTTSGKIQRQACKKALFAGKLDVLADESGASPEAARKARDELRAKILDVVSNVGAVPRERVRPEQSLHAVGIDSLAGVNIAYEIGLMTGRDVPSELLSEYDTLDKLVDYVISLGGAR